MARELYLCIHLADFAAQALLRERDELRPRAVVVMSGEAPLERVFAANAAARRLGVQAGMSRVQAASFGVLLLRRQPELEAAAFAALMLAAQRFSPRVQALASPQEQSCGATLLLDLAGTGRLLGIASEAAAKVGQALAELGYEASVAVAQNAGAALLAARGRAGTTVIASGQEAAQLAGLPLAVLEPDAAQAQTLESWGIRTLGELAALPSKALAARLGESGLRMRALARGEHEHLLAPEEEPADAPITESMELEHPVDTLEPLLFLLGQLLERALQRAAQRSLAIASVESCLLLETALPHLPAEGMEVSSAPAAGYAAKDAAGAGGRLEHRRLVRPALPERERLTLLKLIQLDLELHPPAAAVVGLRLHVQPAPPQQAQHGLFTAQAPEAGRMEVLLARLRKLVGAERVGSPELLDSHAPESFRLRGFASDVGDPTSANGGQIWGTGDCNSAENCPTQAAKSAACMGHPQKALALRMVRPPRAVRIELRGNVPAVLHHEGQRLRLHAVSGPWRTDGAWWTNLSWCREEWDVTVQEPSLRCLRLAHDPAAGCWYLIGSYD